MPDQVKGMIMDSDIKFQCRLLVFALHGVEMSDEYRETIMEIIGEISRLENIRLAGKTREVM